MRLEAIVQPAQILEMLVGGVGRPVALQPKKRRVFGMLLDNMLNNAARHHGL
ncbi:hypothetical protein MPLB_1510094 [Mesorhizobium sp. ORS 3324]|nr:hypothetical protein MPLB_1510094 [Mesorhizobium sp. ORS 3324]